MRASTATILQALAGNAAGPFRDSRALPPSIYHDDGIHDLEIAGLFRKEWICIGREAEIPGTGDYLCREIIESPILVVRQRDGTVRAFANVCAHRSARLLSGNGHVSRISCPYHSWTYELDGQLIGAPFMSQTPGFQVSDHRLQSLPCDTWQGFIYVSLDQDCSPIAPRLAALTAEIDDFRMADYVPVFATEETWATNWKCLVENFMDAYHIHRVHKESFALHGTSEQNTQLVDGDDAFTYHYVQEDTGAKTVAAHADNTWLTGDKRHRTYLVNIFPCHTMQLQPDMLWYLSILPDGRERTNVRWAVSIPAEILDAAADRAAHIDEVLTFLNKVNSEDMPIVENVFRATRSLHARQGPLSHLERNVWQFGRYLARRLGAMG